MTDNHADAARESGARDLVRRANAPESDCLDSKGDTTADSVTEVMDTVERAVADSLRRDLERLLPAAVSPQAVAAKAEEPAEIASRLARNVRPQIQVALQMESHRGPMPSPVQLAKYDQVLPGTAKVIRDEFQANGKHVRDMERLAMTASIQRDNDNRKAATQVIVGCVVFIVLLALTDHDKVAIALAVGTVVPIVVAFFRGMFRLAKDADDSGKRDDDVES